MANINAPGYVHTMLDDGQDFFQFAMSCAGVDALNIDVRRMEAAKPDTSHFDEAIREARSRMARLGSLYADEIVAQFNDYVANALRVLEQEKRKQELEIAHVEMFIGFANEWNPPTPDHDKLKTVMMMHLTRSLNPSNLYDAEIERINALTPQLWHKAEVNDCLRKIQKAKKNRAEEIERCAKRTEWVQQLRKSLDDFARSGGETVCVNGVTDADVAEAMERR